MAGNLALNNGSRVAVVGGGPSGSLCSYFLLDLAARVDIDIKLDIYEPLDFNHVGPRGCNHCGGIVSESLVQMLASEGINLPSSVVQRGVDSYMMHTDAGSVRIDTPLMEKRIAAVYRGAGPLGSRPSEWKSFDGYLQTLANEKGARINHEKVDGIARRDGRLWIETRRGEDGPYDLLVGAVGLSAASLDLFDGLIPGFEKPGATKTYISEFELGEERVREYFGSAMHVFLLNVPRLKFAALIPKGHYVTLVLLGSEIDKELVDSVLATPQMKACFPEALDLVSQSCCRCFPKINVVPARRPYGDRVVLVGDCAVSKLYKNGIGAAYIAAKAAATTAILHGVSQEHFAEHYAPTCRSLHRDNRIGKLVFGITDVIQKSAPLKRGILAVVAREQGLPGPRRIMSGVLWDTFTGSASYRNIFLRAVRPGFWVPFVGKTLRHLFGGRPGENTEERTVKDSQLGKTYEDGEIIVKQGEPGDCLYVIQAGIVEVIAETDGTETLLAELGEKDFFGEMALFEHEARSCTVRARGEARVLTVDRKTLLSRIQEDPSLAFRMLERMSARIRELDRKLGKEKAWRTTA